MTLRSARAGAFSWPLLILGLAACGGSDSAMGPPPEEEDVGIGTDRSVASIELLTDSVRPVGMLGVRFMAGARGRNAAGDVVPFSFGDVVWSTDTPDVLEVTGEGAMSGRASVTSLSEGDGRVIARLGGMEAVIRVPVREVARLSWQRRLDAFVVNEAPTVGPDGTVYVPSSAHYLALEPGGAEKWSAIPPQGYSVSAIGPDGTLYIGTRRVGVKGGGLKAVAPNGTTLWRLEREESFGPPALAPDGTLLAMGRDPDGLVLVATDAETSELLWQYRFMPPPGGPPLSSMLALGRDRAVYFSTRDGTVWSVEPDGEPLWSTRPGGLLSLIVSPVTATDGTIYVGSLDHHLYGLSPEDGSTRWSLDLGYEIHASPALGADGTIYQTAGPMVYAISPGGKVLWSWTMDLAFPAGRTPVVGGDGTVYVGDRRGLFAIGADGLLRWDFSTESAVDTAPAIGLDGTLYFTSQDSMLYASREREGGNGGFDASPWPVWRGTRQNTGRAGP